MTETTLTICSIETWIDTLNKVWAVDDERGRTVETPAMTTGNKYPASLPGLANRPVAISFPTSVDFEYGDPASSWPVKAVWQGETEIHLTPDLKPSNLPYLVPFFRRLLHAAFNNQTLDGAVDEFHLTAPSMELVANLKYGEEAPHHGIVIHWQVVETLTGKI